MKIKSYIAKFDKPMADGTLFVNGCMDQQLGDKIPVYGDGFRDGKVLDGYAVLCKDENGYFVECDISDTDLKKKHQYAGFYGRVTSAYDSDPMLVEAAKPLKIGLFDHDYSGNCYKIEKIDTI